MGADGPEFASGGEPSGELDVAGVPEALPAGWKIQMLEPGSRLFHRASEVEFEVFAEMGFTESASGTCVEYEPWAETSLFATAVDHAEQVQGIVRILIGDYEELPVGKLPTWTSPPQGPVLEYASLAVMPSVRGGASRRPSTVRCGRRPSETKSVTS